MRVLVVGGTGLSGTAVVAEALRRGHDVVAAHRGRTDTLGGLDRARLTQVVHDRAYGHGPLAACGPFETVIDVSARIPAWLPDAVDRLDAGAPWWVQISSISAVADLSEAGVSEDVALAGFDDPELARRVGSDPHVEFSYEWYGPAKAACERVLLDAVGPDRCTILRPVLITGAHDDTWRAPYWVERIVRGGIALAPPTADPIALVDARDLASFALDCAERRTAGIFNLAPPSGETTVADLLAACATAARDSSHPLADVLHVTREFTIEHGIEPWGEFPVWLPADLGLDAMVTADATKAMAVGFRTRPLVETTAAILRWMETGGGPGERGAGNGLDPGREQRLLAEIASLRSGGHVRPRNGIDG